MNPNAGGSSEELAHPTSAHIESLLLLAELFNFVFATVLADDGGEMRSWHLVQSLANSGVEYGLAESNTVGRTSAAERLITEIRATDESACTSRIGVLMKNKYPA